MVIKNHTMKKIFVLLLAVSLFVACNNDKKNPFGKIDFKEKNGTGDDKDNKDDKNDDNGFKTASNWTSKQRSTFLSQCVESAGGNPQAKSICSCVLEKMEKRFPDPNDAENASEELGAKLARECMAGTNTDNEGNEDVEDNSGFNNNDGNDDNQRTGWTKQQRQQFIQGCATNAQQAQGFTAQQANSYCDCMTRKVEAKFSFKEAGRLTTRDLQTPEWQQAALDCQPNF